jgi:hypothetical protein
MLMQMHSYSRWICPNGHAIDREPLDEDALVHCEEFTDGLAAKCGLRMWRKLIVTVNVA